MTKPHMLRIENPTGAPLNEVVDYILETKAALISGPNKLQLFKGRETLLGSGDLIILKIEITYTDPDGKSLEDIRDIIEFAKRSASDVTVTLEEIPPDGAQPD